MRRDACSGVGRLSKKSFIGLLGSPKHIRPPTTTVSDLERARVLATIDYCGGDKKRAATLLGITPDSLIRKISAPNLSTATKDETASSNPTRKFFEGISAEWSVTSFDVKKLEICTEIKLHHGTNRLSTTLPNPA